MRKIEKAIYFGIDHPELLLQSTSSERTSRFHDGDLKGIETPAKPRDDVKQERGREGEILRVLGKVALCVKLLKYYLILTRNIIFNS